MKRAAIALRALIVDGIGIEGFLLAGGTAALAVGSSYLSPAGPWLVVGAVLLLLGIAAAVMPVQSVRSSETINDALGIPNPPEVR